MQDYIALQTKVQNELNRDLKAEKIDLTEFMTALYLVGQTNNEMELRTAIALFQNDFKALARVFEDEAKERQELAENDVQLALSKLIKEDPVKAVKVLEYVKQNPDKDSLIKAFPEISQYFE